MLPRKKLSTAILLCIATLAHAKSSADSLTIAKLFEKVEQNSKVIQITKAQREITLSQQKIIKNEQLLQLSLFGSVDKASNMPIYSNGLLNQPEQHDVIHTLYSSGANLYFNVYNGLKLKNEKSLAAIEVDIAEKNVQKQMAAIKVKSVSLFCDLYVHLQWKSLILKDIEEKTHELKEIQDFYKAGTILESDVLRAELELSKRKMTLIEIENNINTNQQKINMLIGAEDHQILFPMISFSSSLEERSIDDVLALAKHKAYDAQISHLHVVVKLKEKQIVKGNYAPSIGITGSSQFSNPQIFLYPYNDSWYSLGVIGLKLSYNINNLYQNKAKVRKANQAYLQESLQHRDLDDQIRTKVYETFHAYEEAKERYAIFQKNKAFAQENARIVKNAYFSSSALITDLLDANLLLTKANFELEQAKTDIIKTQYQLKYQTGQL